MRRTLITAFAILSIYLGIQLLSFGYLYWHLSRVNLHNLTSVTLQQLKRWSQVYPYISLGAYRLPYIYPAYSSLQQGLGLAETGLTLKNHLTPLLTNSMQGNSINQIDVEDVLIKLESLIPHLEQFNSTLNHPQLHNLSQLLGKNHQYQKAVAFSTDIHQQLSTITSSKSAVIELLGFTQPQHYVVLLQNNMELWPTGGYMGSYAEFQLDQGALKNLQVQAIDVPNGQIKGYVKSPEPITTYVHQGGDPGWTLRASNWDPDFPEGLTTIDWFFSEGGIEPIDTLIGINLIPIIDFVDAIGGIELIDYQVKLTADNFYATTQQHTSYDFFPGSTQKTDFLSSLSRQLLLDFESNPTQFVAPLAKTVYENLQTNQIIFATKEPHLQQLFNILNWDGGIDQVVCLPEFPHCIPDYVHLNETNLGVNKTNCCIDRNFTHHIEIDSTNETITHTLKLHYINHNPPVPKPPENWGGGYRSYNRLYTPQSSKLLSINESDNLPISFDLIDTSIIKDKQVIAFPILVPGNQSRDYTIKYQVTYDSLNQTAYQLLLHKQSGIRSIPWHLSITNDTNSSSVNLDLSQDTIVTYADSQISTKPL